MKVSRKLRSQAILVAACEASTLDINQSSHHTAELLGFGQDAGELAFQAWSAVGSGDYSTGSDDGLQRSAAAEALLRDGWSPGEPTVDLRVARQA